MLRVAGLPIRYWLSAANPDLFLDIKAFDLRDLQHQALSARLADRIGKELVPDASLAREDRALLLAVRRKLHRGEVLSEFEHDRLHGVASRSSGSTAAFRRQLDGLGDREREFSAMHVQVVEQLALEEDRLVRIPEEIVEESPVAKAVVSMRDEGVAGAAALSSKQRRHRSEHAWRRITRSATSSTPRDWLSHVALLRLEPGAGPRAPAVSGTFAARWTENVRARRLALANPPPTWPEPDSLLGLNPLHWDEGGHRICVVLDQQAEPTRTSVRRTEFLNTICSSLYGGALTFDQLVVATGWTSSEARQTLRGFVRHLIALGVLQPCEPPRDRLVQGTTPTRIVEVLANAANGAGWVDVYRQSERGLPVEIAVDLERRVSQALRLLALMRDDQGAASRPQAPIKPGTWRFGDILREELGAPERPGSTGDPAHGSSPPTSSDSAYAKVVADLAGRLDQDDTIDVSAELLDEMAPPNGPLGWPVDCLLRLPRSGAGYVAALHEVWPPGLVDARFSESLADLHGSVPHIEAYRAFLHELENLTGLLFVELLAPPLTDGAANAVRRPAVTGAWTGDPDAANYYPARARAGRYIPLQSIRVRRVGGRLRAEVDGQGIWPVYHATRSFSPPWDRLARILLATAPDVLPWSQSGVGDSLTVFPGRGRVPRITVDGIVVFPAQWRLSSDQLWDRHVPTLAKARALTRLRDRLSLPRWLHLVPAGSDPPVPCDLESLHAIRTLERHLIGPAPIRAVEMLPQPDGLWVLDRAHREGDRLVSEVQLRMPCQESPVAMAVRLAPKILASLGVSSRARARPRSSSSIRSPPLVHC